jgi:hypothetical protein
VYGEVFEQLQEVKDQESERKCGTSSKKYENVYM